MANTWIEPPPPQQGMGCFAKGCLILLAFFIFLGIAFIGGTYIAVRYLKSEYLPISQVEIPKSSATEEEQQAALARWDTFERAARVQQPSRIELTADDINALIASKPKLRGKLYVTIDNNRARLQVSIPLNQVRWLRDRYVNAECVVQSAPSKDPMEARITRIVVNGRSVGEETLRRQYGSWSLRNYISEFTEEGNIKTFEIDDNRIIIETRSGE